MKTVKYILLYLGAVKCGVVSQSLLRAMFRIKYGIKTFVTVLCLLCFYGPASSRNYYIDAENGNDTLNGYSPIYAWQTLRQVNITTFEPGDSILFRSGQEWQGMLFPRGSGAAERPIVVSKYGGTAKPKIHGGHADPFDFEGNRTIQTVLLFNQQHWVISNLEITNMPDNIIEDFDDNGEEKRRGIYVVASDTGELQGITIIDNYIHHVKGDDTKDFHGSGGIMLAALGKRKPSYFNGVHIAENRLYMVNRTGIGVSSYWQRRPRNRVYPESWIDKMGMYQANLNVVIRGNCLESIGGDGIVPQTSFKVLMEDNRVNGAASRSEGYNVGLWAWNSDSALIQYNEVWNTRGIRDGMAFDCDAYSVGHVYQYNFSHDNDGGFMLFHGYSPDVPDAENIGHLISRNISMNDGYALLHFYGSGQTQSVISDNLFYNISERVHPIKVTDKPSDIKITNNIFYLANSADWLGIKFFGRFDFFDNTIPKLVSRKRPPKSRHNITKRFNMDDLRQVLYPLVGEITYRSNTSVTPEDVRQMWDNILRRRNEDVISESKSTIFDP